MMLLTGCGGKASQDNSAAFANKYIDLHLHLDGAITVDIAKQLAKMQDIDLPSDEKELERMFTVPEDCDGGLAIYGKDFGRYPLDPTVVVKY